MKPDSSRYRVSLYIGFGEAINQAHDKNHIPYLKSFLI